jgi:hypothetical protein
MSMFHFFLAASASTQPAGGGGGGGGGEDPPGAPHDLHAPNNGVTYSIAWTDAVAQDVELYRDNTLYDTIAAGVQILAIGTMYGDGTHTWKAKHIDPDSDFSAEITTIDGVVGGGGGPSGVPSGLSTYEFAGGSKFGIQWVNGDTAAQTSLERDGVEYALVAAAGSSADNGYKAGDGTRVWRARHLKNGVYSDYSATLTTLNGEEV